MDTWLCVIAQILHVCVYTDYSVYSASILLWPPPLINSVGNDCESCMGTGMKRAQKEK